MLVPGTYKTAINIHNSQTTAVTFTKKAVIASSEDLPRGRISPKKTVSLGPNQALEIDCADIKNVLFAGAAQPIGKGFVVIESTMPLDVVGIWTVRAVVTTSVGTGVGESIDVEYIWPSFAQSMMTPQGQ